MRIVTAEQGQSDALRRVAAWALPAVLLAAALALRLYRLDDQSLWLDEGSTWAEVTGLTGRGWWQLTADMWKPNAAYPLYHLLMKGWVALAGTSEAALRLPSAIAGALAVPALYGLGSRLGGRAVGAGAALLMLVSPFALWQSQDAKAYSLQILCVTVALSLFWDAFMLGGWRRWLPAALAALVCLLVHRLSLLALIGVLAALLLPPMRRRLSVRWRRAIVGGLVLFCVVAGIGIKLAIDRAEGAAVPEAGPGPLQATGLALSELALLYRAPGHTRWLLLPQAALLLLGLANLLRDIRRGGRRAAAAGLVACLALLPVLFFAVLRAFAGPLLAYETRYLSAVLPAFLLALAWVLAPPTLPRRVESKPPARWGGERAAGAVLLALSAAISIYVLFARPGGILSGAPVKEEYRQAIEYIASKAHPDDVVVVNPPSVAMLYHYYASDHLPRPNTLNRLGAKGYLVVQFDADLDAILHGSKRAWLLEAPDHAALLDPPKPEDREAKLGKPAIHFVFAAENGRWPCGERPYKGFVGVRVYCQAFPRAYGTGEIPEPSERLEVMFGEALQLRGYDLKSFAGRGAVVRPGDTLPVTLYWQSTRTLRPEENYVMFLHLVPEPGQPPVAQEDAPPQEGGLPTNNSISDEYIHWNGTPIHDERAITLSGTLPPGRYHLLLGVYDPTVADNPATPTVEGRLPVSGTSAPLYDNAVELAIIEVVAP